MSCHILDITMNKKFGEKAVDYINRIKTYFEENIKKVTFEFMGKPTFILYHDDVDPDRCWNKFSIGGEKQHNNKKTIDHMRLPYMNLIPLILNNTRNCKECDLFTIEKSKNNKVRILLKCGKVNYCLVLAYDNSKDCYFVLSGYIKRLKK